MSIKIAEENEKVVEMEKQETTEEENKDVVEIQEVKKGPVAWFMGLKTWQKIALGGAAVGVVAYGGAKLRKVLKKNSKQVVEAIEEAVPVETTQELVSELAKAE